MVEAQRREMRELLASQTKWVLVHATSAYKHALKEIFADPSVATRVSDTRAMAEVLVLRQFFEI